MTTDVRNLIVWSPAGKKPECLQRISEAGWRVCVVTSLASALEVLAQCEPKVGILLLSAWDEGVASAARELLRACHGMEWIALLDGVQPNDGPVGELILANLFDYHTLPVDTDHLLLTLGHALGMARLRSSAGRIPQAPPINAYRMVGDSPQMRSVFSQINRVSVVDAPVLLAGESGTGKELAARAIHDGSARAREPFIAVNCAAIPASLMQSELFGHEKGAFTGAHQRKVGRVTAATGGTLFLDEIGDLSLELQVTLLRFLQEKHVDPVGGTHAIPVDVRVLAASHRDLEYEVREGRFREDLYYRLNVLHLYMPALREREGDVERLADHALRLYAKEKRPGVIGFSKRALRAMERHSWPGNVRELLNRVRRAMVMCEGRLITPEDLGLEYAVGGMPSSATSLNEARARAEREAIERSLVAAEHNLSEAARLLGVSRGTLYRLMEKHAIPVGRASLAVT